MRHRGMLECFSYVKYFLGQLVQNLGIMYQNTMGMNWGGGGSWLGASSLSSYNPLVGILVALAVKLVFGGKNLVISATFFSFCINFIDGESVKTTEDLLLLKG